MRRNLAIFSVLATVAGLIAIVAVLNHWLDGYTNAWAFARPPLVRTWDGEARVGQVRMKLVLRLTRDQVTVLPLGEVDENGRNFVGQAIWCDSTGRAERYTISGMVNDRHGHNGVVTFSPISRDEPGLRPVRLDTVWDGGEALRGKAELVQALPGGGTRSSSSDPLTGRPIEFAMRPATEFNCSLMP